MRVAARLRLERMRSRAAGDDELSPEEAKLFQTSDRWVRRFIGFSERRFCQLARSEYGPTSSYTLVKIVLQGAGLVAKRRPRGRHR